MIKFLVIVHIIVAFASAPQKIAMTLPPLIKEYKSKDECIEETKKIVGKILDSQLTGKNAEANIYIKCDQNIGVQI